MKLEDLIPWLQGGNGVKGIPQTNVDECPRGLLINITDMDDEQALKTCLKLMPTFASLEVVKIGVPKPKVIKKVEPRKPVNDMKDKVAKSTSKKSDSSKNDGKKKNAK